MAVTVSEYAYKLIRPDVTNLGINIANMQVPKSLIARPDGTSQILRLSAQVDTKAGRGELSFSTGTDNNKVEHASCDVFFGDTNAYLSEWQRTAYLIQSRVDWLKEAERSGKAHKIGRGLAYKLFSNLVDYNSRYRGMQQVILHSENLEATSQVVFQTTDKDGTFVCCPYWIDSVAHISGFIMNGSDAIDSRESVYISHGWGSMRFAEPLSAEKSYRSYVKMQHTEPNVVAGDVFIFDGERIVASVGGLKFQCIPRRVLNMVLPPVGAEKAAAKSSPARHTAPAPQPSKSKAIETSQLSKANIATVNTKLLSVCSRALEILAAEVGVGIDELVDNIGFSDLGVDSLMSLTVSGKMREELEIDVHSHDFNDHPTIGSFKTFLTKFEILKPAPSSDYSGTDSLDNSTPDLMDDSNATTPPEGPVFEDSKEESLGELIRTTIAEELGVDTVEIADTIDLTTLGLDSLMNLTILGRLREKTDLTLPADLFVTSPSIRAIEKTLSIGTPQESAPPPPVAKPKMLKGQKGTPLSPTSAPKRLATSVLIQGSMKKATKYLWLVPDGGGSATSYVEIPDLAAHIAVLGLNSPYMKVPEEYKCGVIGMATAFIVEMKRRQPTGPYILAGWSAGGVIAFEIANQLTNNSEAVEELILIDSPCPDIIEPLPSSLHRWFASIGLLGDGDASKIPPWLLPHFAASVNALSNYSAEKIDPQKSPHVTVIWCEDGVCKLPTDPRPDPFPYGHAQFLLDNRTDFGPNIWDKYLNSDRIVTKHMPGNHFTMMKRPHVSTTFLPFQIYTAETVLR
jgi:iterative type I PKS product template protein